MTWNARVPVRWPMRESHAKSVKIYHVKPGPLRQPVDFQGKRKLAFPVLSSRPVSGLFQPMSPGKVSMFQEAAVTPRPSPSDRVVFLWPDHGFGSSDSLLESTNPIFLQERCASTAGKFRGRIMKKPLARSLSKILNHCLNMRGQLSGWEKRKNTVFCRSASSTSQTEIKHCVWGNNATRFCDAALNSDWPPFYPITFVCHSRPNFLVFYLTRVGISDNRHPLPKNIAANGWLNWPLVSHYCNAEFEIISRN
jgi:hypothetical protein